MKVSGGKPFISLEAYINSIKNQKVSLSEKASRSKNASEDQVILSPKAEEIQKAKQQLQSIPEVDTERIARIKRELAEGTYKIDGKKVAEKMLRDSMLNEILLDESPEQD